MTAVSLIMVFNDIILLACLNILIQFSQESENAETSVLNEYSVWRACNLHSFIK